MVEAGEGAYLVLAPPGSGKTTVLTARVARLVSIPSDSFRILALTFTNKAALNMREHLFEAVGTHVRRVHISTFHSFCLDIIRSYGDQIGIPTNPSIYDNEDDRLSTLERGLSDDGYGALGRRELRSLLAEIATLKRTFVRVNDAPGSLEFGIPLNAAYASYQRTLSLSGALDFEDILLSAHKLLVERPRVAALYQRMFKYIVLDEAQDTSRAQFEVLRAMCGATQRNVMLVADADQSIFGFAGAAPANLDEFEKLFDAKRLTLTKNFRCAAVIVEAANKLISHNPDRAAKGTGMSPVTLARGEIQSHDFPDEEAEAAFVVTSVSKFLASGISETAVYAGEQTAVAPEDICVLGRARSTLSSVTGELDRHNIRYQFAAGRDGLFETATFKTIEASLRLLANPADVVARRILGRFAPQAIAGEHVNEMAAPDLVEKTIDAAQVTARPILSCLKALIRDTSALSSTIENVVRVSGIAKGDDEEAGRWPYDAETLSRRWSQFCSGVPESERRVGRFVSDLALGSKSAVEGPGVRVLTVHAAKGLEFRAVILMGMNEGTFPDFRSVGTVALLADERRNAYVAVTRAERVLILTRPRTRQTTAGVFYQQPSRFLRELEVSSVAH